MKKRTPLQAILAELNWMKYRLKGASQSLDRYERLLENLRVRENSNRITASYSFLEAVNNYEKARRGVIQYIEVEVGYLSEKCSKDTKGRKNNAPK